MPTCKAIRNSFDAGGPRHPNVQLNSLPRDRDKANVYHGYAIHLHTILSKWWLQHIPWSDLRSAHTDGFEILILHNVADVLGFQLLIM